MQRLLLTELLKWKNQKTRKPLLLDGARQVGKSYLLIEEFGKHYFENVHIFDFLKDSHLNDLFQESLAPQTILRNLEIEQGKKIDLVHDLIVFDEIGESALALLSLKYFCQEMPQIYLVASGSNIGLLDSFPVGKAVTLTLYPMNFYEFLLASQDELLIEAFNQKMHSSTVHSKLWNYLLEYFYTGGMPEVVQQWFQDQDYMHVEQLHQDLINGYQHDFGKYSHHQNALHIERVFAHIGNNLQIALDGSTQRFRFKDIIPGKKRYRELIGPIEWLEKARLISKNYIINGHPQIPLKGYVKENIFKIFLFDIGILRSQLGLTWADIKEQKYNFKGFFAENFVQNELISSGQKQTFSWQENSSELEFLLTTKQGKIIPLEVKSGSRTKAKSLNVFIQKYSPSINIKLTGKKDSGTKTDIRYPLYYTWWLSELLDQN